MNDKILEQIRNRLPTPSAVPRESEKIMPPVTVLLANLAKSVDQIVSGNNELSSPEEAAKRLDVCRTCELYEQVSNRCSKCGCYLSMKVSWANEKCPMGKWGTVTNDTNNS